MSVITTLNRAARQTAVYWGTPVEDGYGNKTFATAVEISVRWEARNDVIADFAGREVASRARVFTLQDVDEEGWLYLGVLDDLDSNPDDPKQVSGAYEIKRFDKIPRLHSISEFVRVAYLGDGR